MPPTKPLREQREKLVIERMRGGPPSPDQRNELLALHHADQAVIVEAMLHGTHKGSFRGLPATVLTHPLTVGRALVRGPARR